MISVSERAARIKLLAMDVDGVLTDGRIILGNDGEELKSFNVHDGMGITLAHAAGLHTAIITGRESEIVNRRGAELKITDIHQKVSNKELCIENLLTKYNLQIEEVAFIGDDLNDVPLFLRVGLAISVADAMPEAKQYAHFTTKAKGGSGAVRELITYILKEQGKWDQVIRGYLQNPSDLVIRQ